MHYKQDKAQAQDKVANDGEDGQCLQASWRCFELEVSSEEGHQEGEEQDCNGADLKLADLPEADQGCAALVDQFGCQHGQ